MKQSLEFQGMRSIFLQKRFIAAITLLVASANCWAEFSPASFGDPDAEKAILRLAEFPDIKGPATITLRCAVLATSSGKFKDNMCYLESEFDQPFASSLFEASRKAKLLPATIDGREKTVYLQYAVEFIKDGEREEIILFPNPGVLENVEEYGKNHFAAQRVVGKEKWQSDCPKKKRYLVIAKAHVNELGQSSHVSLEHGGGIIPPIACQDAITRNILNSLYIPAFADDMPVPSTFVEPYSN